MKIFKINLFFIPCFLLFNTEKINAQLASVISSTQVTYGLGTMFQPKYTTAIGFSSHAQISLFDFFAKDNHRLGFRIRDVNGGYFSLGAAFHPDSATVNGYPAETHGPVWLDAGFDYFGLQMLYGFSDDFWLSIKGQFLGNTGNANYFELFPYAFNTTMAAVGTQIGPYGFEIGRGWKSHPLRPNYFTTAISLRTNNGATKKSFGIRYIQHGEYLIDKQYQQYMFKSHSVNIFYQIGF
ncbi:hypothetical protein BH09BAC5_BH09BAC5_12840 [soil metagenome]